MLPRSSSRAVHSLLRRGKRRLQHQQQNHANIIIPTRATTASVSRSTSRATDSDRQCRSFRDNSKSALVRMSTVRMNTITDRRLYSATSSLDQQQQQQQQQYYYHSEEDDDDYDYNDNSTRYSSSEGESTEPNYSALGTTSKLNLFTAINSAMRTAMQSDPSAIVFGEDVAFGGVFRCSQNLREEFGEDRVFNTPLSENGIAVRGRKTFSLTVLFSHLSESSLIAPFSPGHGDRLRLRRWNGYC